MLRFIKFTNGECYAAHSRIKRNIKTCTTDTDTNRTPIIMAHEILMNLFCLKNALKNKLKEIKIVQYLTCRNIFV